MSRTPPAYSWFMSRYRSMCAKTRDDTQAQPDADVNHTLAEFSLRAVICGLVIGCLLCFTNLYFGLQTGWISMMSLQSALLGYLISRMLRNPLSPQELVVLQTTATATGTIPLAAGFVGIIPAMSLLDPEHDGVSPPNINWIQAIGWSCAVAFFGVFLSPPLRKQVIIKEKLPFPSGTATAQLISVLYRNSDVDSSLRERRGYRALNADEDTVTPPEEGQSSDIPETSGVHTDDVVPYPADEEQVIRNEAQTALIWSFAVSALMTLTAYFFPVIFALPLFGTYLASQWLWWFTPSLSYVGQGIIMGFPTALSMNLGMVMGWAILSPLSKFAGWAPGPVGDITVGARGWILWVSLAIMVSDSFVSLCPVIWESLSKLLGIGKFAPRASGSRRSRSPDQSKDNNSDSEDVETEDRLVPRSWVLWGVGVSTVVGIILVWLVFGDEGIKPWATFLGFLMGGLLSILGVRALGETDLNPVSGLGKISQLLFAFVQPGNVIANLVAGGVAEAGAQQAGDLMQDLKTGHLLRASPRALFYGQLIGSGLSVLVTTTAYNMYTRAYEIPGATFPAPTAYVWLSLARLLRNGHLPEKSADFMVSFALLFGLISAFKTYASSRHPRFAKWIPSGVAFAIGFLNTPSFSIARLIGGIIQYVHHKQAGREDGDIKLIVIASGFVLGEGVVSVVSLTLKSYNVGAASCWGCGHGFCSGC